MRTPLLLLAAAAIASTASAQSIIYGLDFRMDRFYRTDTGDFVGNFATVGTNSQSIFCLDFDQTATTLWGINFDTSEYGNFDLTTGVFTALGLVSGPTGNCTGLTCATDGTWYVSEVATGSNLWVGDVTTGTFTLVGPITTGLIIDISISATGALYGNNISDDSLYSINTTTGAGTLIGPTGQSTNFAQGMDFNWADGVLYATLYTGGGTGVFATLNLTTGAATVLQSTTPLNAEMEMAVKEGSGLVSTPYCFGDGSGTICPCGNSGATGNGCANGTYPSGANLSASGTLSGVILDLTSGTPNQFALFFEGDFANAGGNGVVFGDGLRCAGGNVIRLHTEQMNGNGDATLTGTVQTNGGGGVPGQTLYYQGWYRDPQLSPCGFTFNLTNGVAITY